MYLIINCYFVTFLVKDIEHSTNLISVESLITVTVCLAN